MVLLFRNVARYHRIFHHAFGPEFSLLNLVLVAKFSLYSCAAALHVYIQVLNVVLNLVPGYGKQISPPYLGNTFYSVIYTASLERARMNPHVL